MSGKTSINTYSSPEEVLNAFNGLKVLIIGDVMIDSYLWGKVDRISPEAPVPVVLIQKSDKRLGGAANVALNIQSLGATPILCSVIGQDSDGNDFCSLLQENRLEDKGIIKSPDRITTIKHRIISGSHHMLRLDSESEQALSDKENQLLIERIESLLKDIDVVIFEDYDKGVIGEKLIGAVVKKCNSLGIPTVVDPKKKNFLHYKKVSLFKPNKKELREGLKLDESLNKIEEVKTASSTLRNVLNAESVLVTLSEQGVYVETGMENAHIAAHKREICDVSGAGDTVISVAALCYALKLSPKLLASLSNLAGGIVCEQVGVVPIDKNTFLREINRLNIFSNVAGYAE